MRPLILLLAFLALLAPTTAAQDTTVTCTYHVASGSFRLPATAQTHNATVRRIVATDADNGFYEVVVANEQDWYAALTSIATKRQVWCGVFPASRSYLPLIVAP